jgi:hypothetical protein
MPVKEAGRMKTAQRLAAGLVAAFLVWIAASYIDVVSDNITAAPQHSNLNAFVLLLDYMEEE